MGHQALREGPPLKNKLGGSSSYAGRQIPAGLFFVFFIFTAVYTQQIALFLANHFMEDGNGGQDQHQQQKAGPDTEHAEKHDKMVPNRPIRSSPEYRA
jgi:hypothetical protein